MQAEQLGLAGMPVRLFPCTPSKVATYDSCPRRYHLTYLQRPAPPKGGPWAHNSMGAAVHAALRQWWDLPRDRRTPESAGRLLDGVWSGEGFRDEEQSKQWRERAREWVEGYVATLDPDTEPIGLERNVAATTTRLAVSGRADRIDERDGELVIVDYKTGRRPLTENDARSSQAMAFYVLGARRTLRRPCRRVELHHLPTGRVLAWEHDEESLQRQVTRAEHTADDIVMATDTLEAGAAVDDVFPPAPGPQCGWCDLRRHCAEGQRATVPLEPWSGLADLAD
ncbi:MAG TPA: PD-(D/E)XK nuclease family protein [Mycobacteriales bacterium]|nr:PD-(D/E)XK nuclease family protein [Mycobacteriales bacterium]